MELTEELIAEIEELEGFKSKAYEDVNGTLTIGFGHTNATETFDFEEGDEIDREKAIEILQLDLNHAEETVKRLINNSPNISIEDFSDAELMYATLVYFNRPWTLRNLEGDIGTYEGLELISKGNAIDIREDQEKKFARKYNGEVPVWAMNRLDKEGKFTNFDFEDDDNTDDGGTVPTEVQRIFKKVGSYMIPDDATNELWSRALQELYGVSDARPYWTAERVQEEANKEPTITMTSDFFDPMNDVPQYFRKLGEVIKGKVKEVVGTPIKTQLDFMEKVYNKEEQK